MDRHRDQVDARQASPGEPRVRWWVFPVIAAVLISLAGRLELINLFGTSLPYRDQWKCTAIDILAPWVNGELTLRSFFVPLNDHWPVLTRLLSFTLTWVNGQWNNLLETSLNMLLFAGAAALLLAGLVRPLGRPLGIAFAAYAAVVLALPVAWENILWGIQSLVYFQILISLVYLWAVTTQTGFTRFWWLGQVAGGAVLLTQQSGVLAPAAGLLLLGWRLIRNDGNRRVLLAGAGIAGLWIVVYLAAAPEFTVTASLRADSWRIALDVFLRQLGWPLPHPAWAFLMYLPWIAFTLDRLGRARLRSADGFVIVTGLWVCAQAAAIGYGRGGDTMGFVSRYCDFLVLGFLVNAACLGLLWQTWSAPRIRTGVCVLAVAWLGFSAPGLWMESLYNHAGHNLERRGAINAANIEAVRDFIETRDPGRLEQGNVADTLYTYPPSLVELLADARFRALLPPESGAPEARKDYGRLGFIARFLPPSGRWVGGAGLILFIAAVVRLVSRPETFADDPQAYLPDSIWTTRALTAGWAALTVIIILGFLAWPRPFDFSAQSRWNAVYAPAVEGVQFHELDLRPEYGRRFSPEATRGAVLTTPEIIRPHWYGTLIDGTGYTGILRGDPFEVRTRFLFTPISGWPNWPANAIRWRLENPSTGEEHWISVTGENPMEGVFMWKADVREFQGWKASLHLFDGNRDHYGWVGVARPAATDDPNFGRQWLAELRAERAETTHRILLVAAIITIAAWPVIYRRG